MKLDATADIDRFFTELTGAARKKIVFWSRWGPLGPLGSRPVPDREVGGGTKWEVAGLESKGSGSKRELSGPGRERSTVHGYLICIVERLEAGG